MAIIPLNQLTQKNQSKQGGRRVVPLSQLQGHGQGPLQQATAQRPQQDLVFTGITGNSPQVKSLRGERAFKMQENELAVDRQKQLSQGDARLKSATAKKSVMRSAVAVSSSMNRLASTWAEAYKEGGVGNRYRKTKSDIALWWGGKPGDKFDDTAALPGLKTEIIARMMPILTQQGDKEGSVRLVESIFRKLEKTVPGGETGPKSARSQMGTTIENMFGYTKAFHDTGVSAEKVNSMSDSEFSDFMVSLDIAKEGVTFGKQEKLMIEQIKNKALAPVDALIKPETNKYSGKFPMPVERKIEANMKAYGKSRNEIVHAMRRKGALR